MTLPLPNWRSIWVRAPCRAVSRAFEGSWMLMGTTLGAESDRTSVPNAFVAKLMQFRGRARVMRRGAGAEHRWRALRAGLPRNVRTPVVTKRADAAPFVTSRARRVD